MVVVGPSYLLTIVKMWETYPQIPYTRWSSFCANIIIMPTTDKIYQNFHALIIIEQKGEAGSVMERV